MRKSACRPACAPSLSSATDQGGRFRQRWSGLCYWPTIAPTAARRWLAVWANAGRSPSMLSSSPFPPRPRMPARPPRGMDLAEAWLRERGEDDGAILTTDADSQVAPDWIAENLAAIDAGADAVLGRISLDSEGNTCRRRCIGAEGSRTPTSDCLPNCPGSSTPSSTIPGPTMQRSPGRASR